MRTQTRWLLLCAFLGLLALVGVARVFCFTAWWNYDLVIEGCPDGAFRQVVSVSAYGLQRKNTGGVTVTVRAHFTRADSESQDSELVKKFDTKLSLVDAAGKETPLAVSPDGWSPADPGRSARVDLPDVPDGDYKLRARVHSKLGDDTVDAPLALYAPARVHVVTDRPLYEPGNTMKFRAVVLRARDLAPLDGRPGVWVVRDGSGEILLEEKAPAGPWGVVAGSFPIDRDAEPGGWRVSWLSAGASDEVTVQVEPFTLPRFRVEATPGKAYYRAGEAPVLHGKAIYSSGAPVAGAAVEIDWQVQGEWPAPTEWLSEGLLPGRSTTGPSGGFELKLPAVPSDLIGQAHLVARIGVTDAAGDRVDGAAGVLLSQDGISVSAVTELEDGLVEGFNNRVYLRVTTPDGRPLPGAKINVKRAWSEKDKGVEAVLDEDGVGSLQLDPGPAVNVIIPPVPYRPPPPRVLVSRNATRDALREGGASLEDQLALDGWLPDLRPCALLVQDAEAVSAALAFEENGALTGIAAGATPVGRCLAARLAGKRLPAGAPRLLQVAWTFQEPDLPRLETGLEDLQNTPPATGDLVGQAARAARACLPATSVEGPLPRALVVRARAGSKELELRWVKDPQAAGPIKDGVPCIEGRLRGLTLEEPVKEDGMGLVRLAVALPERMQEHKPQATVMEGYELLVTAAVDGTPATKLRLRPGTVPPLRLRATPVLGKPGEAIALELIRGPGWSGTLPEEVQLTHLFGHAETKIDKTTRKASVTLPADAEGWCELRAGDARALVFVRPRAELAVTVTPDKPKYAPGQTARLDVTTKSGGQGGPAAVGLFGVDESLAQLAPLPGPDDMGRVRPTVTMSAPAFDVLDAGALSLGRIRGANAAAATVLRVSAIPSAPDLDAQASGEGATPFDPSNVLVDRFYVVLAELHAQTRAWEAKAPAEEKMSPATMAGLWKKAVAACAARGEAVGDAFGRSLRLSRLPGDLLAQTDPRVVVAQGTRLPEDVESWTDYVARMKP